MESDKPQAARKIRPALEVYYDGECPLCRRAVRFVLARVTEGDVRALSLTSPEAGVLAALFPITTPWPDSIVVRDGGACYIRSAAALRIARRMHFPWRLLGALALVPAPLRDVAYRWIARRRHCLSVHRRRAKGASSLGA